jgi:hypothetical protein
LVKQERDQQRLLRRWDARAERNCYREFRR